jgi:alpha-amylase
MRNLLFAVCVLFFQLARCQDTAIRTTAAKNVSTDDYFHTVRMLKWRQRGNIYEVNIRQYTPAGTFNAFAKNLDRLKAMGVETLWLMPINPISRTDRKGSLGSYYAVADYTAVNPEFGTLADFKRLVEAAHTRGMKVLIDWVPNHTGADNRWLKEHPDFFVKDSTGKAAVPYDWTDTRQLDYANPILRHSMIAAMKYWITQADIDGFRCDVAWNVPGDFWQDCIGQLRRMKPIFMLAEGDKPYLPKSGFDAVYPWALFHKMVEVAKGERPAFSLDSVLHEYDTAYPPTTLELYFTSNHDENSSNGADYATFPGPAHAPFAVFTQTMPRGIPLIYSGQEEPVLRAIKFFEKDTIGFQAYGRAAFYKTLLELRHRNPALDADAAFEKLSSGADSAVYAFVRKKGKSKVLVVLNFSPHPHRVELPAHVIGQARNVFAGKLVPVGRQLNLQPWGYKVYEY